MKFLPPQKLNIDLENRPKLPQKERIIFQPSWLSGVNSLLNFGGVMD